MESHPRQPPSPEEIVVETTKKPFSRRAVLKLGGLGLASLATLGALEAVSFIPKRLAQAEAASTAFPDIQFDIGNFIAPVQTFNGIPFHFGPVYTLFATATLTRTPGKRDQQVLANALNTIEANFSFSPSGVFTFIAYGLPYFNRLPQSLVASHMPRLVTDNTRFPLEEAVPSPTDVLDGNPQPPRKKEKYNVPVQIEANDVLFSIRSDNLVNVFEVLAWLQGIGFLNGNFVPAPNFNGLFNFTSTRLMFVQIGLPRRIADSVGLSYASEINHQSPMWMGFADQHVNGAGPSPILTFAGNSSARLTTAQPGDYFDNASIQHLSHNINDLDQFYRKVPLTPDADAETFTERLQYMFSSPPGSLDPNHPNLDNSPTDPFTNGGANVPESVSAFIPNTFHGPNAVLTNYDPDDLANGVKTLRGGHLQGLQRVSRAPDGTPLHARMDGPGFDPLDVPDGSNQPKLQFSAFFPTADFFQKMREQVAMIDLLAKADGGTEASVPAGVNPMAMKDNGLERFITATRRQNFLIPPRRHRAFPLLELT